MALGGPGSQEFKNSRIQEVLLKKRSKKEPTRRPLLLFNVRRRIARECPYQLERHRLIKSGNPSKSICPND
jgi:hypothetical protein